MLPTERQIKVVQLINHLGTVKTTELAEKFNCTDETIRRDLDVLAKDKKIVRSHGGAMSVQNKIEDLQYHIREKREVQEKKMIGCTAAAYIKEGETIFIDEGSTSLAMVEFLPTDKEFNLVTNSLLVTKRVASKSNVTLHLLGGRYDAKSLSFSGLIAEESMKYVSVDRFFFSCKGIDPYFGGSEASEERASLKKKLLRFASWKCALADHTKLGIKARFSFVFPQEINLLVSDEKVNQEAIASFEKAGIPVEFKS